MDKYNFFVELSDRLAGLPEEDVQKTLDFYGEMIDERMEEGCSEQEAVAMVGTPKQIAENVWKEMSFGKVLKASVKNAFQTKKKNKEQKPRNVTATVLFWVASPIWLIISIALIATLVSVFVAVYASLWAAVVSFWAAFACIAVGAVAGVFGCGLWIALGNVAGGLFLLGAGIVLAGLAVFAYYACLYTTKAVCVVAKYLFIWTKLLFVKKEKIQ